MNAKRASSCVLPISFGLLHGSTKPFERPQRIRQGCGQGCGAITGYTMAKQKFLECSTTAFVVLHQVIPHGAVNMEIKQAGCENSVVEVNVLRPAGNLAGR